MVLYAISSNQMKDSFFNLNARNGGTMLITTVADNQYKYSNRDYSRASLARKIQKIIGRPSTQQFLYILRHNLLPNCPIQPRDVIAADDIFGPDTGSLKGKQVRESPDPVETIITEIPTTLYERYRNVTIAIDIMYVNKIAFFVTISRDIRFATSEMIPDARVNTIMKVIKHVLNVYKTRDFKVTHILADGQFEHLSNEIASLGAMPNIVARGEHVPEIERHIRTLKERVRAVYTTLPFKSIPKRMLIELIYNCTFWLNCFPNTEGISATMSPRCIITGYQVNFEKHCKLEYGEYVQTHEEHDNSLAPRTVGAIAMRPTGNLQGSYVFYSLRTGRKIVRNRWTKLPMPGEVIDCVHSLCSKEDTEDDDNNKSDDEKNEKNEDGRINVDVTDDIDLHDLTESYMSRETNDQININMNNQSDNPEDNVTNVDPIIEEHLIHEDLEQTMDDNEDIHNEDIHIADGNLSDDVGEALPENVSIDSDNLDRDMNEKYGERNNNYNLRPRKPRDYSHLHGTLEDTVLTQYSLKHGLETFGNAGIEAVQKELRQLHDRDVLMPMCPSLMSANHRKQALPYLMFLKQKRTGQIKGRGCADGRKQRLYHSKEDASLPTVAVESVMLTSVIDAMENRDVATVDIPGAFMQADMDEEVNVKIGGTMVDLLTGFDPPKYAFFKSLVWFFKCHTFCKKN